MHLASILDKALLDKLFDQPDDLVDAVLAPLSGSNASAERQRQPIPPFIPSLIVN